MDDINYHPEEETDAINFHHGSDAPKCTCKYRDPILINHPASKTVFWTCKSCGGRVRNDRIGSTMGAEDAQLLANTSTLFGHRGRAGKANVKSTRLKKETATQGVAMWVNGEIVDAAEYDYSSITRDNRRRLLKSRILFFGIIGVTIIVILIGG